MEALGAAAGLVYNERSRRALPDGGWSNIRINGVAFTRLTPRPGRAGLVRVAASCADRASGNILRLPWCCPPRQDRRTWPPSPPSSPGNFGRADLRARGHGRRVRRNPSSVATSSAAGNGLDKVDMGPMACALARRTLRGNLRATGQKVAKAACGGGRPKGLNHGYGLRPPLPGRRHGSSTNRSLSPAALIVCPQSRRANRAAWRSRLLGSTALHDRASGDPARARARRTRPGRAWYGSTSPCSTTTPCRSAGASSPASGVSSVSKGSTSSATPRWFSPIRRSRGAARLVPSRMPKPGKARHRDPPRRLERHCGPGPCGTSFCQDPGQNRPGAGKDSLEPEPPRAGLAIMPGSDTDAAARNETGADGGLEPTRRCRLRI